MTELEMWLNQAARKLSRDAAAQVRSEILEHYQSAREAAMSEGAAGDDASRRALAALGDAKVANCQYRKVLLTSAEVRTLREAKWETQVICSRPWVAGFLLSLPVVGMIAAATFYLSGSIAMARTLMVGAIGMGILFGAPFLPIYTQSRGRIFRGVKWIVIISVLAVIFGNDALKDSWLLFSCLWPMCWIEWTRNSIRRKLPVAQWPKQLYL